MSARMRGRSAIRAFGRIGGPHHEIPKVGVFVIPTFEDAFVHGFVIVGGSCGDFAQCRIGEQFNGFAGTGRQVAAYHKWAASHAPEGKQRAAFIFGEAALAISATFGPQSNMPQRQHVGVSPMTGGLERRPPRKTRELLVDVFPTIP